MTMLREEYLLLKGKLTTTESSAGRDELIFDNCLEEGWLDHMGITTPKGQRAIAEYEQGSK